ncbi:MAG: G8 domain-containing protein [Microcoleaceae cyanobacterium MO_207.B10]|nr:G8 domain-containing protein [Microcoleaceae cyanobacterium MO_207.B10]
MEHNIFHPDNVQKHQEHQRFLDLLPTEDVTHVAINNGDWSDPNTWEQGQIPTDGAKVLIPEGLKVTYDLESDTRLETVRLDGNLRFTPWRNTKMVVDTFVATPTSTLQIGTETHPISAYKKARIIIADEGPIEIEKDPTLLSRGVITHGKVEIYGAEKSDFLPLQADVFSGDNELVLDSTPVGWRVGDQIVLGGTQYNPDGSNEDNSRFQDEVLTITKINGNRIRFTNNDITSGDNTVLRFDHTRPEGFEEYNLNLYVANTTRNVSIETENGDTVPTQQRGHVMFMHNPDVNVHNAGFYNLGRSDKNLLVDDVNQNLDGRPGGGTNPRGRYSLHFHRTGADDINSTPSHATGNAVVGSPGWGIVHHDSHLVLEDNVVFDVVGSGIAAESGNELGRWENNLTIKTTGDDDPKATFDNDPRTFNFDMGFNGEGYWVQGAAQVEMIDNKAVSAAGGGINIFSGVDGTTDVRDKGEVAIKNLPEELQFLSEASIRENEVLDSIDVTNVPLRKFSGFETYNSDLGIIFWNHMRNDDGQLGFITPGTTQAHDARSLVEDFKLWNIYGEGIFTQYSTQIDFVDGLIVGNPENPVPVKLGINGDSRGHGIGSNSPAQDMLYKNIHIEGFERGIRLPREGADNAEGSETEGVPFLGSRLEDSYFANNTYNLSKKHHFADTDVFPDYFEIVNTQFDSSSSNTAPTAEFNYESIGTQGVVKFDASDSFDPDPDPSLELVGNAIASYAWDFDNDGQIDEFGRQVNHKFDPNQSHTVKLTVWDHQGLTSTTTQTVNITPGPYSNLILDGDFSESGEFGGPGWNINSTRTDEGWLGTGWYRDSNIGDGGAAVFSTTSGNKGLGQFFLDNSVRQGQQTLSLDIKNTEGNSEPNEITVRLWGIDGEFLSGIDSEPQQAGAIPMTKTLLLEETVGGSTFHWKNFEWDVDFGGGYEFITFQVNPEQVNPTQGDFVAIDNVFIRDDGNVLELEPEPDSLRIEAEDMELTDYHIESRWLGSNGAMISLKDSSNQTGEATTTLDVSGVYDVVVIYFDETDGQGELEVELNGDRLDSWSLDRDLDANYPTNGNKVSRKVATGLSIESGDSLKIIGTQEGSEYIRVDYVELVPVSETDLLTGEPLQELDNSSSTTQENQDTILLHREKDPITVSNFEDGVDIFELDGDLTFEQLEILQSGNDTLIQIDESDQLLATVEGVVASVIDAEDFTIV